MKDENQKGMIFLILIATAVIVTGLIIMTIKNRKLVETNEKLLAELVISNNIEPETITITETEIQIRYQDKIITKEVPIEGMVRIDIGKYRRSVIERESLKIKLRQVSKELSEIESDNEVTEDIKKNYRDAIINLRREIKKKDTVIITPLLSTNKEDVIYVKTYGICFKPQAGIGYSGDVLPYMGSKFIFAGKYGVSIGTTTKGYGVGISRRLPYFRNTSGLIMYGSPYKKGDSSLFFGLTVGL